MTETESLFLSGRKRRPCEERIEDRRETAIMGWEKAVRLAAGNLFPVANGGFIASSG